MAQRKWYFRFSTGMNDSDKIIIFVDTSTGNDHLRPARDWSPEAATSFVDYLNSREAT